MQVKYKKCCDCKKNIKGFGFAKYFKNSIMKENLRCYRCWALAGKPKKLKLV
jgi:hypothetical protein